MSERTPLTGTDNDAEQERQRRVNALRALAHTRQDGPSEGAALQTAAQTSRSLISSVSRPGPRWALISAALAVVLALAIVGGYLGRQNQTSRAHALPATLTITTSTCPSKQLWSPDGHTLAVLAFPCERNGGSSTSLRDGIITLYDAATGHVTKQIPLAPVLTDPNAAGGALDGIGWSPDGRQIALEVNASADLVSGPTTTYLLALLPISGGQAQTITNTTTRPATQSSGSGQANLAPIWNVRTKQLTGMLPMPLPTALTYGWSADGRLVGGQSFPPVGSAAVSGRPTGPQVVSFWGDGTLRPVFTLTSSGFPDQNQPPVAVEFTSEPSAVWSPDGSEVTFATYSGLLSGDQPLTSAVCAHLFLYAPVPPCPNAVVPPADAAIAQLATQARAPVIGTSSDGGKYALYPGLVFTWNPQGTAIATVLPADQFLSNSGLTPAGSQKTQVSLLGTDGTHLGTRTYTCGVSTCSTDALAWSPSGGQLALMDIGSRTIMLWNAR